METLKQRLLRVLEAHAGRALDDEDDLEAVAEAVELEARRWRYDEMQREAASAVPRMVPVKRLVPTK